MSKNDITGDEIKTKHSNSYADNFDAIFRKDIKRSLAILEAMTPNLLESISRQLKSEETNGRKTRNAQEAVKPSSNGSHKSKNRF